MAAVDIADAAKWEGDAESLVAALQNCGVAGNLGFLRRKETGKLIVHDWHKYGGKVIITKFCDAWRKKHKSQPTPEQTSTAALFPAEMILFPGHSSGESLHSSGVPAEKCQIPM